jgi:hypothetical protein
VEESFRGSIPGSIPEISSKDTVILQDSSNRSEGQDLKHGHSEYEASHAQLSCDALNKVRLKLTNHYYVPFSLL